MLCLSVLAVRGEPPGQPLQPHHVSAAARVLVRPETSARLRDGDLVFRAGRDLVSNLVLQQREEGRFSHVGVLVRRAGVPYVVHAVPEDAAGPGGVRLERLDQFAASEVATRVACLRPRALAGVDGPDRRSRLRAYALAQLGKPFDDELVYSDDSQLYCTELALKALASAGVDVRSIPRVRLPLHAESLPLPDDLSRWPGLAEIDGDLGAGPGE